MEPFALDGHLRLQPRSRGAHGLLVEGVLLVGARIHHVHARLVAVQDLELLGIEPRLVQEVGGADPRIERVPRTRLRSRSWTNARRLPGVRWVNSMTRQGWPSMRTTWPRRMSVAFTKRYSRR